jgi:Flp pilus assembly protein TadG
MIGFFKRLMKDCRGNMLVIAGASLPLLGGAAGLAIDTIEWSLWKRQLQRAADSGAISGVYDRNTAGNTSGTEAAVLHDLTLNHHTGIAWVNAPAVTFPADAGDMRNQVQVVLTIRKQLPFSSMFMTSAPIIRATARAASVPGSDEYCVVSLENRASKSGIIIGGSSSIDMDCGMISNSPAVNSAMANGNASTVKASVIAAVGGVQSSSRWTVPKYDPYVDPIVDPYLNVNPTAADVSSCASNPPALTESTANASSLTGGCFSSLSVGSNRSLTLGSGTYYITGKNASTAGNVTLQGTLTCNGCTIVLTNKDISNPTAKIGTFDMNAQSLLNINPPTSTSNKYRGIAVYQDRRATEPNGNASPNKFNGGGAQVVEGALYFPSQEISYSGNGTATAKCTRFVAKRVVFTGNNSTSNKFANGANCGHVGLDPLGGGRRVRLVA